MDKRIVQSPIDLPAWGAEKGDWLVIDPNDQRAPVTVMRFPRGPNVMADAQMIIRLADALENRQNTDPPDVDAALARMREGKVAPEPRAWELLTGPDNRSTPKSRRQSLQKERVQKRLNKLHREQVPVECRDCGEEFYRKQINQVRCQDCIDRRAGR